jgi:cysteinyl-tRNA synthetase
MEHEIKIWNTLSGKKDDFKPVKPKTVGIYNCGPTVYNYAHIGNLRAYIFADILRRTFEYNGYSVKQVMNITDVGHLTSDSDDGDDKMVKALKREGKAFTLEAMKEVADFYTKAFIDDLQALNCKLPHEMPKASEHITEDIEIIKILFEKDIAYKTSDGIYFDLKKFPEYGKLGNINIEGQLAGARVVVNSEKRNAGDFSLWKFSENEIGWQSPWGRGFPGWHIECSAMSRKYLGQPFDIHTGGIDHIPVHHNNEIAQSESAFGAPLANYWMHNEHLIMKGEKLAKSSGNVLYLKDLVAKGISPVTYRYFILLAGYRTPINFIEEIAEKIAGNSLKRIYANLAKLPEGGVILKPYVEKFLRGLNNDLNTAEAISIIHELLNDNTADPKDKLATILDFDRVLGLDLQKGRENALKNPEVNIPESVLILVEERKKARANKDWKKSDDLRMLIEKMGFAVKDSGDESIVSPI